MTTKRVIIADNNITNSDWTKAKSFDFPGVETVEDFERVLDIPSSEPARSERLTQLAKLPWVKVAPKSVQKFLSVTQKQSLKKTRPQEKVLGTPIGAKPSDELVDGDEDGMSTGGIVGGKDNIPVKPKLLKRLRTSIDEWFTDIAEIENERIRLLKKLPQETRSRDLTLHAIGEIQGFNGLPIQVKTKAEGDKLKAKGWTPIYRGLTKEEYAEQLVSGDMFHGVGIFGNGTYTTQDKRAAAYYASADGYVVEMFLSPDAKIITTTELTKLQNQLAEQLEKRLTKTSDFYEALSVITDHGRLASILGYDAIRPDQYSPNFKVEGQYYNVLNRAKLAARVLRGQERADLIALSKLS